MSVFSRIRTRKTANTDTFHAVPIGTCRFYLNAITETVSSTSPCPEAAIHWCSIEIIRKICKKITCVKVHFPLKKRLLHGFLMNFANFTRTFYFLEHIPMVASITLSLMLLLKITHQILQCRFFY